MNFPGDDIGESTITLPDPQVAALQRTFFARIGVFLLLHLVADALLITYVVLLNQANAAAAVAAANGGGGLPAPGSAAM